MKVPNFTCVLGIAEIKELYSLIIYFLNLCYTYLVQGLGKTQEEH